MEWIEIKKRLPPYCEIVDTKIDDKNGIRNEQKLQLIGRLWFNEDGKTYVYYTPTHWKKITKHI